MIVREKDLSQESYEQLASRVMKICTMYHVPCILHTYVQAAAHLGAPALHLPLQALLQMTDRQKKQFACLGASVHSVQEAVIAQKAGAGYLTAGHVFATDCKHGRKPRGLSFLRDVCRAVEIPVCALGGIQPDNAVSCIQAGAKGVCMMSGCMQCPDVQEMFWQYHRRFQDLLTLK